MIDHLLTRRGTMRRIALAVSLTLVPGHALAAVAPKPAPTPDRRTLATAALLHAAFPHKGLDGAFYQGVATSYIAELKATPPALAELDRGIGLLDGSYIAPFAQLPGVIQKGLVEKVDQEPFFKALLWRGAELIYRDPTVWKLVGFEGSSVEYGGYHERGFDDIDWLPKGKAEAAA